MNRGRPVLLVAASCMVELYYVQLAFSKVYRNRTPIIDIDVYMIIETQIPKVEIRSPDRAGNSFGIASWTCSGSVLSGVRLIRSMGPTYPIGGFKVCYRGPRMSSESLPTHCGSTATLVRGLELASMPLPELLRLKEEPLDEEEQALRDEMKVHGVAAWVSFEC